jgi:hypothetical protein
MSTKAEKEARLLVRERSGGICEICGAQRATNFQHRKARGQGGLWTPSNGLDVCGMGNAFGCHGYIHQNPRTACLNGWTVQSWSDERDVAVKTIHGFVLLDDEGGYTKAENVNV